MSGFFAASGAGGGSGTVTSVDLSASGGLTASGGPIISSGSINISTTGRLSEINGLAATADTFVGGTGSALALRTAAQTKTSLALNNVENTALSTWAGSANITTLGTITAGTWNGTTIAVARGGTGLTTVAANRLLGTGGTVDGVQAITVGSGLSLSGGTLTATGGGGGTEFADNVFRITGSADATKKLAFEVDGLTTATTRTVTQPNFDGSMVLSAATGFTNNYVPYGNSTGQLQENAAFRFFTAGGLWTLSANSVLGIFEGSNTGVVQQIYRSTAPSSTSNFPAFTFDANNSAAAYTQIGRCAMRWSVTTAGSETGYSQWQFANNGNYIQSHEQWADSYRLFPYGTGTGNTTGYRSYELVANGSHYVEYSVPDAVTTTYRFLAPAAPPASILPIKMNSSGALSTATIDTAEVTNNAITLAKLQTINTSRLLGRGTAATGNVEEIAPGNQFVLDASGFRLAKNGNTVPRVAGQFYTWPNLNTVNTAAVVANTLYAAWFPVWEQESPVDISMEVTTLLAGNVRLGIYRAGTDGRPGALVVDAGTASTSTAGVKTITLTSVTLVPDNYFLASIYDAAPTVRVGAIAQRINVFGQTGLGTALPTTFFTRALTYGALPATFGTPTVSTVNSFQILALRY